MVTCFVCFSGAASCENVKIGKNAKESETGLKDGKPCKALLSFISKLYRSPAYSWEDLEELKKVKDPTFDILSFNDLASDVPLAGNNRFYLKSEKGCRAEHEAYWIEKVSPPFLNKTLIIEIRSWSWFYKYGILTSPYKVDEKAIKEILIKKKTYRSDKKEDYDPSLSDIKTLKLFTKGYFATGTPPIFFIRNKKIKTLYLVDPKGPQWPIIAITPDGTMESFKVDVYQDPGDVRTIIKNKSFKNLLAVLYQLFGDYDPEMEGTLQLKSQKVAMINAMLFKVLERPWFNDQSVKNTHGHYANVLKKLQDLARNDPWIRKRVTKVLNLKEGARKALQSYYEQKKGFNTLKAYNLSKKI